MVIDCPPSLGLLTLNALVAADGVVVPMQAEYFALEGLSALNATIEKVRAAYNPRLTIDGVLFTMFDARLSVANQVRAEVEKYFGDKVFEHDDPAQRAAVRGAEPRQARRCCTTCAAPGTKLSRDRRRVPRSHADRRRRESRAALRLDADGRQEARAWDAASAR